MSFTYLGAFNIIYDLNVQGLASVSGDAGVKQKFIPFMPLNCTQSITYFICSYRETVLTVVAQWPRARMRFCRVVGSIQNAKCGLTSAEQKVWRRGKDCRGG